MKKIIALSTLLGLGALGMACGEPAANNANANLNRNVANALNAANAAAANAVNQIANATNQIANAANAVSNAANAVNRPPAANMNANANANRRP